MRLENSILRMIGYAEIVNTKNIYVNDEPLVVVHQEEEVPMAEEVVAPAPAPAVAVALVAALPGLEAGQCRERFNCKYLLSVILFFFSRAMGG
jgi:hypothetical protein